MRVTLHHNRIEENGIFGVIAYAGVSADRCTLNVELSNNISRHNDIGGAESLAEGAKKPPQRANIQAAVLAK